MTQDVDDEISNSLVASLRSAFLYLLASKLRQKVKRSEYEKWKQFPRLGVNICSPLFANFVANNFF